MRGGGAGRPHHRIRACDGMVTAELAIALLAVIPLLMSLLLLVGAAATKVQVVEGARTAARMLARGQAQAEAVEHLRATLPGAEVLVREEGSDVVVEVHQQVELAGVLPAFTMSGSAVTPKERDLEQ